MPSCVDRDRLEIGATDKELLVRYQHDDPLAFGLLYDRYASGLFFFAHSLIEDSALAEDLVQESFLRLLDRDPAGLQDFVRGLLYTILRNLACDEARRRRLQLKSYPLILPSGISPERTGSPDHLESLSRALHALPAEQRETIILKNYGEFTFSEIARILGVPEATVKSRYRYALEKLAQLLQEDQGDL
jgi:RNA polymerase sigma-70 factor (ECF subfamily)